MDVYKGTEKVAELGSYDEIRVGDGKPAFIYEGNELVYPNPVKDGLVLWYDFSGRTNDDAQRDVAEDLSGNGNHGTLQNFNYSAESGYDKNKLLFDGVDDVVNTNSNFDYESITVEVVFSYNEIDSGFLNSALLGNAGYEIEGYEIGNRIGNRIVLVVNSTGNQYTLNSSIIIEEGKKYMTHLRYDISDAELSLFMSGIKDASLGNVEKTTSSKNLRIGRGSQWYYHRNQNIHSTKVYNRPLSNEEIAHNYEIEKERFGIE